MKICLQYFGMLNTFEKCYKEQLETFNGHSVDVYMTVWNKPGHLDEKHGITTNKYPELQYPEITEEFIKTKFTSVNIIFEIYYAIYV